MAIKYVLPQVTTHLRRLESGLIIPATTGIRTFVTQREMFPGHFDEYFVRYGTDVPTGATDPIPSDLFEIIHKGKFRDILGSFNTDPKFLFWRSQNQILTWVENHTQHIHPMGWATFFPFIVGNKRLVARVRRDPGGGLGACVRHFARGSVWIAECGGRLVLPQLGV